MSKTLRQHRHSCLAPRARVRASLRALLLCGMAASCAACPAVVDLDDPEHDPPDVADLRETDALPPPGMDDAGDAANTPRSGDPLANQGVIPPLPPFDPKFCPPPPPPPGADADAGAQDAGPGGRGGALANSPPDPAVAVRAVLAAGYALPCGAEQTHVLQLPDGYELSALGPSGLCAPFETMLYRLRVSKSGQISILSAVTPSPAQLACDAGEPALTPEQLAPPLA